MSGRGGVKGCASVKLRSFKGHGLCYITVLFKERRHEIRKRSGQLIDRNLIKE